MTESSTECYNMHDVWYNMQESCPECYNLHERSLECQNMLDT